MKQYNFRNNFYCSAANLVVDLQVRVKSPMWIMCVFKVKPLATFTGAASARNFSPFEPLDTLHPCAPTPHSNAGPYGFYEAKRPRALQKTIDRSERAGSCERQNVPRAAIL